MSRFIPAAAWIACIVFAIWIADTKKRSALAWGLLAIPLGPIALIAIGGLPELKESVSLQKEGPLADDATPWNPLQGPPDGS